MISFLKKIWLLLDKKEKFFFFILLFMMCTGAYLELMGIGLVLPIIAALTNPVLLQENKLLKILYDFLSPSSTKNFMLILCFLLSLVFLLKTVFFLFLTKLQANFTLQKCCKLEETLFKTYIHAPYLYHLNKNTAEIFANFNQLKSAFASAVTSCMLLLTEFICIFFIFLSLFIFTPGATCGILLLAGIVFLFIFGIVKRYGNELGKKDYACFLLTNKILLETFHSMKEVKLYNCEERSTGEFSSILQEQKKINIKVNLFGQAPRFLIELFMVIGAMLLLASFLFFNVANTSILLKLSLICIALIRLMPSFSRIQYNYTNVKVLYPTFDNTFFDLFHTEQEKIHSSSGELQFNKNVEIKDVSFSYISGKEILKNISFTIPANSSCAFIGKTGCGKTTLADIIIGLLPPTSGTILADGVPITDDLIQWRKYIGYVPQHIQLFDDTIAANVAFGVKKENIDMEKLKNALQMAQAWEFVSALDKGVNTFIGENGLRLSGGQRQRLGIARALYHDPKFLVLDEATSALDNETEKAFMDAVGFLRGKLTMLIIAHRLTTIKGCDSVIDLTNGKAEKLDPATLATE
ncbi:MAG: ABC transporter ATP-binding protein [Lentisphaeria bacterium]|nr:ABC transporter ATP-binding protein [Lentisphaeria bacterium]